ncbi:MAG: FtsW/RodA/SpoVE family cell cycle protein, partial [Patescibacteria group bacterium]|nr:FtsW/RodA/SpoVE family cell cycle protein [Patescibacteria group bacterium]
MTSPRAGSLARPDIRLAGDWTLLAPAVVLTLLGILTMHTFGQGASLAPRQLLWLGVSLAVYVTFSTVDMRFIRRTPVILAAYGASLALLAALLVVAHRVMGAKAWFTLGPVSFQPADLAKLALLALLAKYLSRRHVEIADWRHILVTVAYVGFPALLILVEPDLGNTIIFGTLWLGMMLVSGVSYKQLGAIILAGLVALAFLWFGGLHQYQRQRILSFVNPAADIRGAGYNAYQAKIAVGSGELLGKGIGYGTQSKLRFLPEFQTDFIFAAFAEEWGFVGVLLLLAVYGIL